MNTKTYWWPFGGAIEFHYDEQGSFKQWRRVDAKFKPKQAQHAPALF